MPKHEKDRTKPIYLISVVCDMLGVHPQTLRLYEREGLIQPLRRRTQRLYSESDLERLNLILQLTREMGVNKAGVEIILRMRRRMEVMQSEMEEMLQRFEDDVKADFRERLRKAFKED